MKKKTLLSVFALLMFLGATINVNAKITAKAPTKEIPNNSITYAVLEPRNEELNASHKIGFTTDHADFNIVVGTMRKIAMVGKNDIVWSGAPLLDPSNTVNDLLGTDYFTTYCLDGMRDYPQYSLTNNNDVPTMLSGLTEATGYSTGAAALAHATLFSVINSGKYYEQLAQFRDQTGIPNVKVKFTSTTPDGTLEAVVDKTGPVAITGSEGTLINIDEILDDDDAAEAASIVNALSAQIIQQLRDDPTESVTVDLLEIDFSDAVGMTIPTELTAAILTGDAGVESVEVELTAQDILVDTYTTRQLTNTDYNRALWIIDHSFPTYDLDGTLANAGVNYETLKDEILGLYTSDTYAVVARESDNKNKSTEEKNQDTAVLNSLKTGGEYDPAKVKSLIEDYVYATVQYSIWYTTGYFRSNGTENCYLGDTLLGSEQLNRLYQWLIQDRAEYNNYSTERFTKTVTVGSSDAKLKENKDYYTYGPYVANYTFLETPNPVTIALAEAVEGASIVDKDGNAITTVVNGDEFYIKCKKANRIANVTVNLNTTDAVTFENETTRGRVYYAQYPLIQNTVSGGIKTNVNVDQDVEITFNPKTGVQNVALIFVITLVAFTLGYVVLSYKNKPVELN